MADNYLRVCRLTAAGKTYTLDDMQVQFTIRQARVQMPGNAVIRIYNLSDNTKNALSVENQAITLEAGYQDHYGIVFKGSIKRANRGKIGGTDTYCDLYCADGDQAYIKAQVIKTLPKGSTRQDVVDECVKAFGSYGVSAGFMSKKLAGPGSPQPIVLFGLAREIMRGVCKDIGADWKIQDGKVNVVHKTESLPGADIVVNSQTGLVGRATQTFGGIIVQTLINPAMHKDRIVRIDEKSIDRAAYDPSFGFDNPQNDRLPGIATDGRYRVWGVDRVGSMRGPEWYDTLYCAAASGTNSNPPQNLIEFRQ